MNTTGLDIFAEEDNQVTRFDHLSIYLFFGLFNRLLLVDFSSNCNHKGKGDQNRESYFDKVPYVPFF